MAPERVEASADGECASIEDKRVDHGSGDVFVDEEFLKHLNAGAGFEFSACVVRCSRGLRILRGWS